MPGNSGCNVADTIWLLYHYNKVQQLIKTWVGVPSTQVTLYSWSISLMPGNSGCSRYNSAIMQPIAQMSIGEL